MCHIRHELFKITHGLVDIDYVRPIPLLNLDFGSRRSRGDLWEKVGTLWSP